MDFHPISYEALLLNPSQEMSTLLQFCQMSTLNLSGCLRAMERDSQQGSFLSKEGLKYKKPKEWTVAEVAQVEAVTADFGLPPLSRYQEIFDH